MFGVVTSDDDQPVTWMGRYPIHVTTLLVMVHVVCMILSCFLIALGGGALLGLLAFDSAQVISNLHFWQIATYAFVHSPSGLIWFAIEMYMLFAVRAGSGTLPRSTCLYCALPVATPRAHRCS